MNILCKIFGHKVSFDNPDGRGSSYCKYCKRFRCNHVGYNFEWLRKYYPRPNTDHFSLFEKLKDFYAQPIDGCWPLRPCWVPDLDKPPKHVFHRISSNTRVNQFRRFTFEEFVQILGDKE